MRNFIAADIPNFMHKREIHRIIFRMHHSPDAKFEIPWQVSIRKNITPHYHCGGTILDESTILTAGHCFDHKLLGNYEKMDFRVVAGAIALEDNFLGDTSAQVQFTEIC